ncbi:hypothetical protein B0H21DRAFT_756277 [Amylocystis lapponica]|nr:hypothetical protein B0H21DRAFT_756277 [Amylocystis lapponica]
MDEASGEVVAEVPHQAPITEDPALAQQDQKQGAGSLDEKAGPVVLELPPDAYDAHTTTGAELLEARQLFVRAVPPEEQDWIMKSAMLFSRAIDSSTSLILTGVTSASTYYINHSTPAPYAPDSNSSPPSSAESAPNPPRVLQALTSPQAHAALAQAHTFSGQAVRVSQRTVELVEGMIRRAVGGQPTPARSPRQVGSGIEGNGKAPQPSTPPPPPPYTPPYAPRLRKTNMEEKPGLPPRHTPVVAGIPPPLPPRSPQPSASSLSDPPLAATESAEHHPNQRLHKGAQLVLSANLVLAALDDSVRRMWDGSSASLNAVVQHKYGSAAAHSTHLASHTARNVVLVYIDMRGFARRALIKKAGTQWVRGQVAKAGKSKGPSTLGDSKA